MKPWLQRYSAILLTAVAAMISWIALQAVDVRDKVLTLNATMPVHFQAVETRLTTLESHAVLLESRDDNLQQQIAAAKGK